MTEENHKRKRCDGLTVMRLSYTAALTAAAIFMYYGICGISTWLVRHEGVWTRMDAEGASREHIIAEVFHQTTRPWIFWSIVSATLVLSGIECALIMRDTGKNKDS